MSNEDDNQNLQKGKEKAARSTPEIRYIPIDIQAVENEEDKIDIYEVLQMFWKGRRTIIKTVAVFIVLGLLTALVGVKQYTSDVRLIPENDQSFSLGSLGGIAQQFGFSSFSQQNSEEISVALYPAIINSNVFMAELMEYEVTVKDFDEKVTLERYFREYQQSSIINTLMKYTVMLPFTIKSWLFKNEGGGVLSVDRSLADENKLNRLMRMSNNQWEILRNIRGRITTNMSQETGVFTISVTMEDPLMAADVADEVVQMLSEYITENRTEKARRELEFIEERYEEAKSRFEEAQKELAEFNDQNRGQLTAMTRTEEQLLQSRYNLNFNLYNSMAQRLEEARINLQEETPVINILEPAAVPDIRSAPRRTLIVVAFTFVGFILGFSIVIFSPFWIQLKNKLKKD